MYNRKMKTLVSEAWRELFKHYPRPELRDLWISIEFPVEAQHFPGIWITYEDTGPVEIAGIDQKEFVVDANGTHEVTRWTFSGRISMTAAALTSRERDKIIDEMIRSIAFSRAEKEKVGTFRFYIENNDLIGMNVNFDQIYSEAESSGMGTPWGTDEVIYEKTLSLDVIGEFVSDPSTNKLVILSEVQVEGYPEGEPVPEFPDETIPEPKRDFSPYSWH